MLLTSLLLSRGLLVVCVNYDLGSKKILKEAMNHMTHSKYFYSLIKADYTELEFCFEGYLIEIKKT